MAILVLALIFVFTTTINSFAQASQNNVQADSPLSEYQDYFIALITIIGGGIFASRVVNRWQKNKDISQIRERVLTNFGIAFKKSILMMDNFMGRLIIQLSKINIPEKDSSIHDSTNSEQSNSIGDLRRNLAWNYTFADLDYYKSKVKPFEIFDEVTMKNKVEYTSEDIGKFFNELDKEIGSWIVDLSEHRNVIDLKDIKMEFERFETSFHSNIDEVTEFSSGITQYYYDKELLLEFHAMWEYMMGGYFLIRKIKYIQNDELPELLQAYIKHIEFLHGIMLNFELKLINGKIKIK